MSKKEYSGSCYIGVVGPETDFYKCRDSIASIKRQDGDSGPFYVRATKGYEARQMHLDRFMESEHDFILLLDHDMVFPEDTLERLRSHKLPYVSGFYMRRQLDPPAPVWYEEFEGEWPYMPLCRPLKEGELIPIGASGWGCILLHRDVVVDVRRILKGEQDIIEDDMDVWPYDAENILSVINAIDESYSKIKSGTSVRRDFEQPEKTLEWAIRTLKNEFKPLRMSTSPVGSDIRYPFFAKQAGYTLYGDTGVSCGHVVSYPISLADWNMVPDETIEKVRQNTRVALLKEREKHVGAKRA